MDIDWHDKIIKIPNYSECMQVKTVLEKIYIT